MTQGKILVIRGGAIGDFILTLPVLAALREQFPQTRLEVLGYSHIAQLAVAGGLADNVRSIEARPLAGFFARNGTLAEELQEYFAGFAIIVSYLYDPDGVFQANVARCSKAQFIAGPHRPEERAGVHATEVFLKPLERLAIFGANPVPRLNVAQASSLFGESAPLPVRGNRLEACATLALHPGSGSERKNWPEAKWSELLHEVVRTSDVPLLLVGGEAEGNRLEQLAAPLPSLRVQVARSLPLVELAYRLTGVHFFIGHDSGISHLAAALGLPVLVLWGETVEAVWRPPGERVTIVRDPRGLAEMPVAVVQQHLETLFPNS